MSEVRILTLRSNLWRHDVWALCNSAGMDGESIFLDNIVICLGHFVVVRVKGSYHSALK